MISEKRVVFLLDVDDTLLDNDAAQKVPSHLPLKVLLLKVGKMRDLCAVSKLRPRARLALKIYPSTTER